MTPYVSHDRAEETPEAKARWFKSLTIEERLDIFCEMMDMIYEINPEAFHRKNRNARPLSDSFQVLELPGS